MPINEYRTQIKELPEELRPRERLQQFGREGVTDVDLLAIALGSGRQNRNALELAQDLISQFGGLRRLATASVAELCEVPGIGPAKATQVIAAFELGHRMGLYPGKAQVQVSNPDVAARMFRARIGVLDQEEFWAMLLDTQHNILRMHRIYRGSVSSAEIRVCEVFREAIKDNAKAIIVAHNHPSGLLRASEADCDITRALVDAAQLLEISLLDHLIVTQTDYASLKRERPALFAL